MAAAGSALQKNATCAVILNRLCRVRLQYAMYYAAKECPSGYKASQAASGHRFVLMENLPVDTAKKMVRKLRNLRYNKNVNAGFS